MDLKKIYIRYILYLYVYLFPGHILIQDKQFEVYCM